MTVRQSAAVPRSIAARFPRPMAVRHEQIHPDVVSSGTDFVAAVCASDLSSACSAYFGTVIF